MRDAWALPAAYPAGEDRRAAALPQRLLNFILFITVLTSFVAFIEPSPHDALVVGLLIAGVAARVKFDRKLTPLLLLLIAWLIGGFMSLVQVGDEMKPVQYVATSFYLCVAALTFASLVDDGDLARLAIVRRAYVIAALLATAAGYIGFFHLTPHSDLFLLNDRVSATFKDPNVYGPFLIFPLMLLMTEMLTRGVKLVNLGVAVLLLGGLLLSFSRGAWLHFVVTAIAAIALLLAAAPDRRMRGRIILLGVIAAAGMALLLVALVSIDSVHDMFIERAKAIQPYDVGPGGRFWEQRLALNAILDHPNGMGPFEFFRIFGVQQHNVYMQGFLVYGWFGGAAYLALVLVTVATGLRVVLVQTPWQTFFIAAYATFVGEAVEGLIVDTDHWRHFFLLLGLIWGLSVATINFYRRSAAATDSGEAAAAAPARARMRPPRASLSATAVR